MAARELNLRSKELMTVGRLRMVKENSEKGRALGRLNVTTAGMPMPTASPWVSSWSWRT